MLLGLLMLLEILGIRIMLEMILERIRKLLLEIIFVLLGMLDLLLLPLGRS